MMKNSRIRFIIVFSAILLLLFTSINIYSSYVKMKKIVEESIVHQGIQAAKSIASGMDIEGYKRFLENPKRDKDYWEITNYLNDTSKKVGALYVYTLKVDNPKIMRAMVAGLPREKEKDFLIGEASSVPEKQAEIAFKGETFVTDVIDDPDYGTYLTVGVPIKDERGKVISYLGVDISAETINIIKVKVLENNILNFIFSGLYILIVIGCFFFLQRWYQKEVQKEVGNTEDTYQAELKTLITSVSSLRHDFTNHIQVLYGFLQLGESEQAKQYVASLFKEVRLVESMKINSANSGLSILLETKKLAAQNHHIQMEFSISPDPFDQIKTTDLIIILSNLVDNAIDATNELPASERKITIFCKATEKDYVFKVTNTGPNVLGRDKIFELGYSTKKRVPGKIRGQGLFIVKEVITKYHGNISIESTSECETTFVVEIPLK